MRRETKYVTVRELMNGYKNLEGTKDENGFDIDGVVGYGGNLNIRPPYQREFVYNDKEQALVIDSVLKDYDLGVMYWTKNDDGMYEIIDGQQRTISLCKFVLNKFSVKDENGYIRYFYNLTDEQCKHILDYQLEIKIIEGTKKEKLEFFERINVQGEKLTPQELLNIHYTGAWLSDAKLKFSKRECPAYRCGEKYVKGTPIRQEYLETALRWISNGNIVQYMADHSNDKNANELWYYFVSVINWVQETFKIYRREMKGVEWGFLYNKYHNYTYDSRMLEEEVKSLLENEEVTDHKGIFEYLLDTYKTGEKVVNKSMARKLSKRLFSEQIKRRVYEKQKGICPICGEHFEYQNGEADHIVPWCEGGTTTEDNCQILCKKCNREKGGK